MVSTKHLAIVMKGITAARIKENGSKSLLPNRKSPTDFGMYRQGPNTPGGTRAGSKQLNWRGPLFLCLGAMFALSGSTGFRKSEVALSNGMNFDSRAEDRSGPGPRSLLNGGVRFHASLHRGLQP